MMFRVALVIACACSLAAASDKPFDGRPWNVSTGNLSVAFIRQSPTARAQFRAT